MIGIIGAMDEEVAMLKEKLTEVQVETKAAMDFYKGKLEGKDVVVVRSGIGKVNAAMCAQILADVYHADHVINTGIAGSLKAEINIGDIVLSTDALQHDMDAQAFGYEPGQIPRVDTLSFKADEKMIALAKECCEKVNPEIGVFTGRVVSGDQFISDKEKKITAFHEAGHAVVGIKLDGANDVQKITIIPRGMAGGYNLMLPKEETYMSTKKELLETISGFLGGRVAEEIVFNEVTTGAHNDFEKATKIARSMVTEYGMSSLGPVQLEHQESSVFLGRDYNKSKNFSDAVALEIDQEVRKIISEQYEVTKKIISENMDLLNLIANALLEHETITKEQIDYLVKYGKMPEEDSKETDATLKELKEEAKELGIKGYSKLNKEELEKEINDKKEEK